MVQEDGGVESSWNGGVEQRPHPCLGAGSTSAKSGDFFLRYGLWPAEPLGNVWRIDFAIEKFVFYSGAVLLRFGGNANADAMFCGHGFICVVESFAATESYAATKSFAFRDQGFKNQNVHRTLSKPCTSGRGTLDDFDI